tara:strand:- start:253 stop:1242 length:990 start_codon:yes stop_codon:yes gene_type:complete
MSSLKDDSVKLEVLALNARDLTRQAISNMLDIPVTTIKDFLLRKTYNKWWDKYDPEHQNADVSYLLDGNGPNILTLDIETAPIKAYLWGLWQQNVGLNGIQSDWYILSWSAKWFHQDEVMYEDKRDSYKDEDDYELLQNIWKLLDEADIIITQNGKKFDAKKLNARFILNGMGPPSSYRHIDTLQEAKKHFGFTSNKLEYMTDKLCKKYKKLKHSKFAGLDLWVECLAGNPEAWNEMEVYNIHDVLSLEELYTIMRPYMRSHFNFNLYFSDNKLRCVCGNEDFTHNGYHYTNLSKFDRFACTKCGHEHRGRVNLLSKEKRETLGMNVLV